MSDMSPCLFNLFIDGVVREVRERVMLHGHGRGMNGKLSSLNMMNE